MMTSLGGGYAYVDYRCSSTLPSLSKDAGDPGLLQGSV